MARGTKLQTVPDRVSTQHFPQLEQPKRNARAHQRHAPLAAGGLRANRRLTCDKGEER